MVWRPVVLASVLGVALLAGSGSAVGAQSPWVAKANATCKAWADKPIEDVMDAQADLVEVRHQLRQVLNYKGT